MNERGTRSASSPESIAAILSALVGVAIIATSALALQGTVAPGPSPSPSAAASAQPTMDPQIRNALVTALAVNQSLVARAEQLDAAAGVEAPQAPDLAALLRAVNADLTAGDAAANRLVLADDTADLGEDLLTYYRAVLARNNETLGTSIRNVGAYVEGARAISAMLADLPLLSQRITDALARRDVPSEPPSEAPSAPPTPQPTPAPATPPPAATASPASPGSPGPEVSASPVAGGPNLVANGDFEAGAGSWQVRLEPPAQAAFTVEAGAGLDRSQAARVDISVGSQARAGVSLISAPFELQRGSIYVIEVWARSAEPREVRLSLTDAEGLTTAARNFAIAQAWSKLTFDVTQLLAGPAVVLSIDLGRSDATVWFDNASVRALGS